LPLFLRRNWRLSGGAKSLLMGPSQSRVVSSRGIVTGDRIYESPGTKIVVLIVSAEKMPLAELLAAVARTPLSGRRDVARQLAFLSQERLT